MTFLHSDSPPIFLCKDEELDYLRWKEWIRKLEKKYNEFAFSLNKKQSFELVQWISTRKLWCEKCNNQFYSNEGYVSHGCFQ